MNERTLKEQLLQIKEQEWALPSEINPYEFALEMMNHIGSTDPELRDHLILECLWVVIERGDLTEAQLKELLNLCLSDQHLFHELGIKENDGVFNRAFTVLIIGGILEFHLEHGETLLSQDQIINVFQKLVNYIKNEKDRREYVETKGWADATGHWALTFACVVKCSAIGKVQLRQTLELIQNLVCTNDLFYCHDEDERFTTVVMNITEREIIPEQDLLNWINSFETIKLSEDFLDRNKLCVNRKNFLRSLYFRVTYKKSSDVLNEKLEQVILAINPYNR